MTCKYYLSLLLLSVCILASASELKEILPVHHQMLALHFVDGEIFYHGYHQTGDDDQVFNTLLDVKKASRVSSYKIGIAGQPLSEAFTPERVGRKSKANGISMKNEPGAPAEKLRNLYVSEHWIYLELPFPLQPGKQYTIYTADLATNENSYTFLYDPKEIRSPLIHLNTVGFQPDAPVKKAYLSLWTGEFGALSLDEFEGTLFSVNRLSDGKSVYSGKIRKQKDFLLDGRDIPIVESPNGNYVATDVWECDFSAVTDTGEYKIVVDNMGCSFPFPIKDDVYREPFRLVTRGLYHQRSGIALEEPYTEWTRPAPHNPKLTPGFKLKYSHFRYMDTDQENAPLDQLEALIDESVETDEMWGWYQDAGDWDAYTIHSVVPAFLLTTFELKPANFRDGELNIPESGNGIPDIIDEAGWLIHHYMRTKGPTGGNAGGRIEGDNYPNKESGKGLPSYEDIRPFWIVYGEEPLLTYIYSRLAAQYAYAFETARQKGLLEKKVNASDSIRFWKEEALFAYNWANNNLREGDDAKVRKDKADAAAWLFKLTGENRFLEEFREIKVPPRTAEGGYSNYPWGVWALSVLPPEREAVDPALFAEMKKQVVHYGETEVTKSIDEGRSYNMGNEKEFPVFLGHATTPLVMPAIMAYEASGDEKFLRAVYMACNYMLGGNPLDKVWITGLNEHSVTQIFHMDSWYNKEYRKGVVPGLIPYGPTHPGDWMPGRNGEINAWGWWDNDYNLTTCYPHYRSWPVHELWFEHRYSPPSAEYTVHQTIAPAVAVYGYLTREIKKNKNK